MGAAFPLARFFRLSAGGVHCGPEGLFVGAAPLLRRAASGGWEPRPADEAEAELADLYGLPIDLSAKAGGLATVSAALGRGDAPLAAIAAVLLGFPDPPGLTKGTPERGGAELATQLAASGLLKDWNPDQHPRVGEKPNPGWFAAKPPGQYPPPAVVAKPSPVRGTLRDAASKARAVLKVAAKEGAEGARWALWTRPELKLLVEVAINLLEPTPLNRGEQQVIDRIRAAMDPPKALLDLQQPPSENVLGYQRHHIVEQNPDNIAKSPFLDPAPAAPIDKFGRVVIDDPSNLVWVPTFKHEQITGYYNATDSDDPLSRLHRRVVDELDFAAQRALGLGALRLYGVLQ